MLGTLQDTNIKRQTAGIVPGRSKAKQQVSLESCPLFLQSRVR
jgi:hypothetical protein